MKTAAFCGHSQLGGAYEVLSAELGRIVSGLIADEGCRSFLVGSYGQFDRLAASVCLRLKKADPAITVRLVVPYYQPQLDSYEQAYRARFDEVIVPALKSTPYRYRIVRANEYMINCADVVIAYVRSPTGGAARTLAYAKRKKRRIICV